MEKKTTLRIEIDKTIQPKQYEPIKIQVSVEETFCWSEEKDREKKMKFYRDLITNDFVKCFDLACIKIGEKDRCIGNISTVKSKKNSSEKSSDEEWDF